MQSKWDERYGATEFAYGEQPNNYLKENLNKLPLGSILFPAEGEGRNAVYLAQKGFEVTGIDFSETATQRAKQLAKDTGVNVDIKTQDLTFFIVPLMKYATIVLTHFKAPLSTLKTLTVQAASRR